MPELSIIVPCFDEQEHIPATVDRIHQVVTHASLNAELILLDDESRDRTLEVAASLIDRYPSLHIRVFHRVRKRRGFGATVRFGMAHATGRWCAFVSADGLDPLELLPEMIRRLRAGAQHVQCSRFLSAEDEKTVPTTYRLLQWLYRGAVRLLLGQSIRDSTYGFKAFDRVYVQALGVSANRFAICPEITFKVLLSGGKLEFVPGHPAPFKSGGSSKFEIPGESIGYAWVLGRAWLHRIGLWWF